ncbi:MAG: ABC transporter ATP-binding protein [Roseimicrobium sp.]
MHHATVADKALPLCFGARSMPTVSPLRHLFGFASRYPGRVALGLTMALFGTLLGFVLPNTTRWLIDEIIPQRDTARLWSVSVLTLAAMFVRQLLYTFRTLANNAFQLRMTYDLRSRLHDKIQHLPLKWFDRQSTGDIIVRMSDDVPATQRIILEGVDQFLPALLQIGITAAIMFSLHVKLTLVTLLPVPLIAAGAWVFGRWIFPRELQAREAAGGLASVLSDNVAGIRQIKSYTLEEDKQRAFNASSERYKAMQTKLQQAWSVYAPGMGFVGDTGVILLMGFGSWWCITGELSIGQMGQFLLLIGMLYEPIGRLNALGTTFVSSAAAARRVFDILQLDGAEDLKRGIKLHDVRGEIRFENVSFRYDENRPTLSSIDLEVKPGQTVAIVGATGAGKSTLFQILTRFYDADEGDVLLDGKSVRELNKASLRDAIGYVTQENYLFNQTVRENLKLGKPDATDADLWQALEAACAKEFVERLDGQLDAPVGERGSRLSGGEKQRIAIARAFLKDAPILLLDEATSAVDTKSERLIQQAIDRLRINRTCLVIAHRLSTIKHANCIYVMKQGNVLAHGTHEELLKRSAYYAELAKLSFTEERLAE